MWLGLTLSAVLMASSVQAATLCNFDMECLEAEACTPTTFSAERTGAIGDAVSWTTDAETLSGFMIASDDNLHFVFEAASAAHLLSEYPDGSARYTIHMDGPFTITYHGFCEDKL